MGVKVNNCEFPSSGAKLGCYSNNSYRKKKKTVHGISAGYEQSSALSSKLYAIKVTTNSD
jgi:hypothetical protein